MDRGNKEFRLARGKRIERFAQRQERVRKFVRLSELIDYHATGERGVKIDEEIRYEAYKSFIESILSGYFEHRAGEKTKAKILFLSEQSPPIRLGAEQVAVLRPAYEDGIIFTHYLQNCWLPFEIALRWCEDKKMTLPPAWRRTDARSYDGAPPLRSRSLRDRPPNKGGRPPAVHWDTVKGEVFRLMDENSEFGPDDPTWNAQARLEEKIEEFCFSKFGRRPAPSSVQANIKPMLDEWRKTRKRS
jgi:hypothetical protein